MPSAAVLSQLPLASGLADKLRQLGITAPEEIQATTLSAALAGRDVLGRGRTGPGRTLTFGFTVLTRVAGIRALPYRPSSLVLVPTRDRAQQVADELAPYAELLRLRCVTIVGGMSIRAQTMALRRGAEVLVATPGRLVDLVNRGECRVDRIETAVVDEADRMAGVGLLPQVNRLLEQLPPCGQRMVFSDTPDVEVDRLVGRFLADPVTYGLDPQVSSSPATAHHLLEVQSTEKQATVAEIAAGDGRVIMFVHTKSGADRLARQLLDRGVRAAALHGGKSHGQRSRALDQFRTGALNTLVATNVAARGIHVDELDLVVNVDPPADGRDYLHHGGPTARAARHGTVVTLVLPHQRREVSRLMASAGIRPDCAVVGPGHPVLARVTGTRRA